MVSFYTGKIKKIGGTQVKFYDYGSGYTWDTEDRVGVGRNEKKSIDEMTNEELVQSLINRVRSVKKSVTKFQELYLCNQYEYKDIVVGGRCRVKMVTLTTQENITDRALAWDYFKLLFRKVERFIAKKLNLKKFGIFRCSFLELHKKNRETYHMHSIAFNLPKLHRKHYEELKQYIREQGATIRIDSSKNNVDFTEENKVVIKGYESLKVYASKIVNYISKVANELKELDYSNLDKIKKFLKDLDGKLFTYSRNLKKPVVVSFTTEQEKIDYIKKVENELELVVAEQIAGFIPFHLFIYDGIALGNEVREKILEKIKLYYEWWNSKIIYKWQTAKEYWKFGFYEFELTQEEKQTIEMIKYFEGGTEC